MSPYPWATSVWHFFQILGSLAAVWLHEAWQCFIKGTPVKAHPPEPAIPSHTQSQGHHGLVLYKYPEKGSNVKYFQVDPFFLYYLFSIVHCIPKCAFRIRRSKTVMARSSYVFVPIYIEAYWSNIQLQAHLL